MTKCLAIRNNNKPCGQRENLVDGYCVYHQSPKFKTQMETMTLTASPPNFEKGKIVFGKPSITKLIYQKQYPKSPIIGKLAELKQAVMKLVDDEMITDSDDEMIIDDSSDDEL